MAKITIRHTMLNVSNIQRSLDFYVNKLGLKMGSPPREVPYPPEPEKNMFIAFITDEEGNRVELGSPGYTHVSLAVDDVEKTVEEFKGKGIEVAREPFPMPGTGRNSPIWFKDPDGVYVEIVKRQ